MRFRSFNLIRETAIALIGLTSVAGPAIAQSFDAESLGPRLTEFARSRKLNADQYEQLARLIPSPTRQVQWLGSSATGRNEAGDRALAREIIMRADARVQIWRSRGIPLDDNVEQTVTQLIATLTPVFEVTNPSELLARLRQTRPEEIQSLDDVAKFILFARGVGDPTLQNDPDGPDDFARTVGEGLSTEANTLPAISKLLDWSNRANAMATPPAGGPDGSIGIAHDIATALVARSLGLDGADRLLPEQDTPAFWEKQAQVLEKNNLWRWATLARLLQASTAATADDRRLAAIEGKKSWTGVQQVSPGSWPAVSRWLDRVDREDSGELEIPGRLPLSVEFRDRGRKLRLSYEQQFLTALSKGDNESAFRFMQLAKAADLTLLGPVPPPAGELTIDLLKQYFGRNDIETGEIVPAEVHLYLEILEITADGGAAPRLFGFVLRDQTTGMLRGDKYVVEWIQGLNTPKALVQQAVAWMPAGFVGGRFVIAPDGKCRGNEWLDAEKLLLDRISAAESRSWLVYVPTAAALQRSGPWGIDATIRAWNLSVVAASSAGMTPGSAFAADPLSVITDRPGGSPFAKEVSPIRSSDTFLTALQLDRTYSPRLRQKPAGKDWNWYPQEIVARKKQDAAKTLAVLVSRP